MHVRRVVVAVAVVGLAASGCSSEPPSGELDLEGDEVAAAPATPDPPAEVTEDPPEPSESPEPPEDDQLYPPLPPLEPDPNSDVSIEDQQFFLQLHSRVYDATYEALTTNEYVLSSLENFLTDQALAAVTETVDRNDSSGSVLRFPDATVVWVRVIAVEGSRGVVQECRIDGPDSGPHEATSGKRLGDRAEAVARIIETTYALVELESGTFEHRATQVSTGEDPERCDAA